MTEPFIKGSPPVVDDVEMIEVTFGAPEHRDFQYMAAASAVMSFLDVLFFSDDENLEVDSEELEKALHKLGRAMNEVIYEFVKTYAGDTFECGANSYVPMWVSNMLSNKPR